MVEYQTDTAINTTPIQVDSNQADKPVGPHISNKTIANVQDNRERQ